MNTSIFRKPLVGRIALLLLLGGAGSASAAGSEIWRFTHSMGWNGMEAQPAADTSGLRGRTLGFSDKALSGAAPFACAPARTETYDAPAEGLFEGGLPAPADAGARAVGVRKLPVAIRRITCPNAGFDFVQVDAQTRLVALDNRIWSLSNTPGTRAAPDAPEGVVQVLLESHFAGPLAFTPAAMAPKRRWLSTAFLAAMHTYFARSRPQDEVPPIDGDALTNRQEAPTRFAVGAATVQGKTAQVPVRFADGWAEHSLRYTLVREKDGWKLDDVWTDDPQDRGLRIILEKD